MKKILLMMAAGGLMLSCAVIPSTDDPTPEVTDNDLVPIELPAGTRSFVEGGNDFAFNLLQRVEKGTEGSFLISPLSVGMAFGLLVESAEEGAVLDAVTETLGFGKGGRENIRAYCSTMMERLPEMDKLSKVRLANLVLTNRDFGKTNAAFEQMALDYYDALVKNLSFGQPKVIVDLVNAWASEKTEGMIPEAIKESDLSPQTTAVLANALYFNGKWTNRFQKSDTAKEDFTPEGGKRVKVDMMKQEETFSAATCKEGTALRLPYGNKAFEMTVILPNEGVGVDGMVARLAKDRSWLSDCSAVKTDLWLPKFKLSPMRTELNDILSDMGMRDAFYATWLDLLDGGGAESTISKVFQTATIDVDESGTEAAAVTVITAKITSPGPGMSGPLVFHADRPFIFTISESSTGAILFAGVYRGE